MKKVALYVAKGCSLCVKAHEVLDAVRARVPFDFEQIDIRTRPMLYEAYRFDIPVVLIEGEPVFRHRVTEEEFEARLLRGTSVAQPP